MPAQELPQECLKSFQGEAQQLADEEVVGKVGHITGGAAAGKIGEVMIPIRGGVEAFHAYASDPEKTLSRGMRVVVLEYLPPRTVVVAPM